MENEVEVMRIVRVPPMGKMVVTSGENRYQHISQVQDESLKQRIMAAIGELVTFADGYSTLVEAGLAPPLGVEMANEVSSEEDKLELQQMAFLESLEKENNLVGADVTEQVGDISTVGATEPNISGDDGPLSITGLINPILQKHVAAEPELRGRTVKLAAERDGALNIIVDGKIYKRPEDIPDAEVRKVLRAALKEWDST
jgi:hypothetical protein